MVENTTVTKIIYNSERAHKSVKTEQGLFYKVKQNKIDTPILFLFISDLKRQLLLAMSLAFLYYIFLVLVFYNFSFFLTFGPIFLRAFVSDLNNNGHGCEKNTLRCQKRHSCSATFGLQDSVKSSDTTECSNKRWTAR